MGFVVFFIAKPVIASEGMTSQLFRKLVYMVPGRRLIANFDVSYAIYSFSALIVYIAMFVALEQYEISIIQIVKTAFCMVFAIVLLGVLKVCL